ncbi:hypothetical protein D1007_11888 [Hordeum vulgare]|nr:hypothetical protein D1007_11888 [Hordeum vulgare]
MGKGKREAKAAHAAREDALKVAKAAAKHCKEAEARLQALQGEHAKLVEQHRLREEGLEAREAKLAAREERMSQEANLLSMGRTHLEEQEKEVASRKVLLDAHGQDLAAADRVKAAELARFPDVELKLPMTLRSLYWQGFDKPLATREGGFATLATELAVALEDAVVQVDKILDCECRDLFLVAATRVLIHLHLRDPGFDLSYVILQVPTEARDRAAEAVKGPMEAFVKRFAPIAAPSSRYAAKADDGEDDASDIDGQPRVKGATSSGSS